MKKKKKKPTISDKALANAVKKGDISIIDLPKEKRLKIKKIINTISDFELEKASKNKYKISKRKILSKNKNESMKTNKEDFKKIITNLKDWEDKIKGGLAKDKTPSDYDIENLSKGAEIQMEHTDDPEEAIDIAMDHLEEFEDYYDDERGLPAMERDLENEIDENEIDEEITSDDDYFNDYEKINDISIEKPFIKKFSEFKKTNESNNPLPEPKMYPRENKFKRVIEYDKEIEDSLNIHNFNKISGYGDWIIFDIMKKSYQLVSDYPEDIRPCDLQEFDHMMDNL